MNTSRGLSVYPSANRQTISLAEVMLPKGSRLLSASSNAPHVGLVNCASVRSKRPVSAAARRRLTSGSVLERVRFASGSSFCTRASNLGGAHLRGGALARCGASACPKQRYMSAALEESLPTTACATSFQALNSNRSSNRKARYRLASSKPSCWNRWIAA